MLTWERMVRGQHMLGRLKVPGSKSSVKDTKLGAGVKECNLRPWRAAASFEWPALFLQVLMTVVVNLRRIATGISVPRWPFKSTKHACLMLHTGVFLPNESHSHRSACLATCIHLPPEGVRATQDHRSLTNNITFDPGQTLRLEKKALVETWMAITISPYKRLMVPYGSKMLEQSLES